MKRYVFNSRLNSFGSVVSRISAGNPFHATGPETENSLLIWGDVTPLLITPFSFPLQTKKTSFPLSLFHRRLPTIVLHQTTSHQHLLNSWTFCFTFFIKLLVLYTCDRSSRFSANFSVPIKYFCVDFTLHVICTCEDGTVKKCWTCYRTSTSYWQLMSISCLACGSRVQRTCQLFSKNDAFTSTTLAIRSHSGVLMETYALSAYRFN